MLQNKHIITVGGERVSLSGGGFFVLLQEGGSLLPPSKEQKTQQSSAFGFKCAPQPLHSCKNWQASAARFRPAAATQRAGDRRDKFHRRRRKSLSSAGCVTPRISGSESL